MNSTRGALPEDQELSAALPRTFTDVRRARSAQARIVRVLLADREGVARRALAALLRDLGGVTLVGEVASPAELPAAMHAARPDVLVIDDRLLRAREHARSGPAPFDPRVRVIVVGADDDPAFAARARRLGAEAWIAKDRADDHLPLLLAAS